MQGGEKNNFVKGMLSAEFPRVRQLLLTGYEHLRADSDAGKAGALGEPQRAALLEALQVPQKSPTYSKRTLIKSLTNGEDWLQPLASQHLSRALSRVNDGIAQLFSPKAGGPGAGVPPLPGDVAAVQKTINTIVLPTRVDAKLALAMAQSMRGAIDVLVAKCGDNTSSDIDVKIGSGALRYAAVAIAAAIAIATVAIAIAIAIAHPGRQRRAQVC